MNYDDDVMMMMMIESRLKGSKAKFTNKYS